MLVRTCDMCRKVIDEQYRYIRYLEMKGKETPIIKYKFDFCDDLCLIKYLNQKRGI